MPEDYRLSPNYWDGRDIFDESQCKNTPEPVSHYESHRGYNKLRAQLLSSLGKLAANPSIDSPRFTMFELDEDMIPGSLVVIEQERIQRQLDERTQPVLNPEARRTVHGSEIKRPYAKYWLEHQDGTKLPGNFGEETIDFGNGVTYDRFLQWGVVFKGPVKRNYVQPFPFAATKLLENGSVYTPRSDRRNPGLNGPAVHLWSRAIGFAHPNPRFETNYGFIDSMSRIRSVDLVYAHNEDILPPKKDRSWNIGRISLPQWLALPDMA